nr:immunoglobulin heavy chain junction region [Macaca mulatta]
CARAKGRLLTYFDYW